MLRDTDFYQKHKMASSDMRACVIHVRDAYPTHPFYKLNLNQIENLINSNIGFGLFNQWSVEVEMNEDGSDCKITDGYVNILKIIGVITQ